jgi:hypothetical protein
MGRRWSILNRCFHGLRIGEREGAARGGLIELEQVGQGYVYNILGIEDSLQVIDQAHFRAGRDYFDGDFGLFLADIGAHEVNGVALGIKGAT